MNGATLVFASQLARLELQSALPTAPAVGGRTEAEAQPVRAARSATASVLRQVANLIAPAPSANCG
jgi:hypothetical protein